MTVWATIVLERLGFERREALSLAYCYVNTTSTARGVSLGIISASEQDKTLSTMGSNQPHFELMGVKIPLIKLGQTQEWRGISKGEVIGPDQAFNYMRKSMCNSRFCLLTGTYDRAIAGFHVSVIVATHFSHQGTRETTCV